MANFERRIAVAVQDQLLDARFNSRLNHTVVGGRVFYVLKTAATNYTQFVEDHPAYASGDGVVTTDAVYNTVDAAIGACTADQGDVIYVMPGHTETLGTINLDIAGVTVICLGNGENKPFFTYDAAADEVTVAAADVTWMGGYFFANFLDVASAFQVDAAKNFRLEGAEFQDSSSILNFLSIVTTTTTDNDADGLEVIGCNWFGLNTTPLAFISILGATQVFRAIGNTVDSAATSGCEFVTLAAKAATGTQIRHNVHTVVGATGTTTGIFLTGSDSGSSGDVSYNFCSSLDTTSELFSTASTGLVFFENRYTGTADASGKLLPAVDAA